MTMLDSPQAIFFALDGTLTDPKEGITRCIQYTLERLDEDVPPAESLTWCIGPPLQQTFEQLVGESRSQQAIKFFRERFSDVGWSENKRYDGILESLDALKQQGHTLYIATSKPHVYATRIANHFSLGAFFTRIFGSELDGTHTDKADLLKFALHETSVGSNSTMIGDRHHDIRGALLNQMHSIGVTYGYGSRTELVSAGAHLLVDSPQQLSAIFSK